MSESAQPEAPAASSEPVAPSPAAAEGVVTAATLPIRVGIKDARSMAYTLALISEGLFSVAVSLLDARELNTSMLDRIGEHNRVLLPDGRERIACANTAEGTTPLPPLLSFGALSEGLALLRDTFPDWTITLRSGEWSAPATPDHPAAQRLPGWLAELGTQAGGPACAGFHQVPEVALFYAALEMASLGPTREHFAGAVGRMDVLFVGAKGVPHIAPVTH